METSRKPLKSQNITWLGAVLAIDVLVLVAFALGWADVTAWNVEKLATRAGLATLMPVAALLLAALIPADVKATLVYWRIKDTLPGHRAFSKHAPSDSRIDLESLRKNVGAFPSEPREQNTVWYRLYKKVASDAAVEGGHKGYLLFRDLAAISIVLTLAAPIGVYLFLDGGIRTALLAGVLMLVQYLLAAIAARNSGVRFVTNVLAIHSAKRVTTPPASKARTLKNA